jgi:hypothetical protein
MLRDALRQAEVDGHGDIAERGPGLGRDAHARGRPLEGGVLPEVPARARGECTAEVQGGCRLTQGADEALPHSTRDSEHRDFSHEA